MWDSERLPWVVLLAVGPWLAAGCLSRDDTGSGEPPTLAVVQARIFSPRCGIAGCHGGASPMMGMNLEAGRSAELIIGVKSVESPLLRIKPGDPDASYLIAKVEGRASEVGGSGARMPLNGTPLGAAEIQLLRDWVVALGNQPIAPSLQTLTPDTGELGETITLAGANFGAEQGDSTVLFGTTPVTEVVAWADTELKVKVPAGLANGVTRVKVSARGLASSLVDFTVRVERHPVLSSVAPDMGVLGQVVTLEGTDFGDAQDTSTVQFGNVVATTVQSWTATKVEVVLPARATTGDVTITVDGNASTGQRFFVVVPRLSSIQAAVFDRKCSATECHGSPATPDPARDCPANATTGPLSLLDGQSYFSLVGVDSCETPGTPRVRRGWRAHSQLLNKLNASPSTGERMPNGPGAVPLAPEIIEVIATWIDLGANNN